MKTNVNALFCFDNDDFVGRKLERKILRVNRKKENKVKYNNVK